MEKRKMIYVIIGIFVILLLAIIIVFLFGKSDSKENEIPNNSVLLQYGDKIADITYKTLSGDKDTLMSESGYSIVFYIDPYCGSCLQSFVLAEQMNDILEESVDIKIVWKQEPSKDIIRKIGIDKEKQFVLDNIEIANPYPTYFITDNKGNIVFIVDELDKLSKKVVALDCLKNDEIIELANKYFLKKTQKDSVKPTLIYFAMDGCKDCAAAEELLDSKSAQKYYDIVTVYTENSYGEKEFVDVGKLFVEIYGINWYPSFVIIKDGTYQFIGESSVRELEDFLFDVN